MAGRPYTTACSPNKMIFPGAVAEIAGMDQAVKRINNIIE
jgi:hypothetical protein